MSVDIFKRRIMTKTTLAHGHQHTAMWINNCVGILNYLYSAIKFILLLPCTQVYCENDFFRNWTSLKTAQDILSAKNHWAFYCWCI